jgi:hypothetical protein
LPSGGNAQRRRQMRILEVTPLLKLLEVTPEDHGKRASDLD